MTAKLLFLDGDITKESFTLKPEGTSFGRETDNDIILQEGEISRHHARILQKDGEWIFKDLGSSAGTTVNDLPVKEAEQVLAPGDIIIMGRHKFKFEPGIGDVTMIGGNLAAPKVETSEEKTPETPKSTADKVEEAKVKPHQAEQPVQSEKAAPAKKDLKPVHPKSAVPPTRKKGAGKVFFGCGGCGCLLTLLLLPAGIFMMIMAGDSHLSELGPFGFILTPIAALIFLVSIILLIIGFVVRKKNG